MPQAAPSRPHLTSLCFGRVRPPANFARSCNNNWNSGFNDAACKTMLPGEGTYSACRLESFSVGQCNQLCGTAYRFMLSSDATTIEFFVGDCALGVKPSVGTFPIVQVHGGQNGGEPPP